MQSKPVGWFEIYVHDMPRARAFYEAVFETRLEQLPSPDPEWEMWTFPGATDDSHGASGALVKSGEPLSHGNGTVVYFMSENCAVEAARVEARGGRIERAKFAIGDYGFAAMVKDTEGNLIGIHSMK